MPLIPEMTLDEFQCKTEDEVRAMPSVILLDGEGYYLGTLILPKTDYLKMKAEFMGEISNGLRPKQK